MAMFYFYLRDMYGWKEKREVAIQTFNSNKESYMHVAVQGLEKDLKISKEAN